MRLAPALRKDGPGPRLRAGLSATVFLAGLLACNRDFSTPYSGDGDGVDTVGSGGVKAGDTVSKEPVRPDSVAVTDMQLTAGDPAAAPQITWYPADFADKRYTLISDNAPVAKVEAGKLKPLAAGEAGVSLITEAGRLMRQFTVTVKSRPKPPDKTISVISVTAKPMSLWVGQEAAPQLTWNPANATHTEFSLASQDPDVADTRGTKVVAKAAGAASIVVTARDGGKTAVFTVTVKEEDRRVRLQALAVADLVLSPGEEREPAITWTPADVTDKGLTLISSDPSVVSVNGLKLRGQSAGTSVVMAQPADNPSKAVAFKVKVAVPLASLSAPDMSFTLGDASRAPQVAFQPADASDRRYRLASANPAVAAIVQDTLVEPRAVGEARIALTPAEGASRFEFTVRVSARVIPVLSISVQDMTLKAGDPDADPAITWNPPDATDKTFTLAASASADPAASAVGLKVHPLKAGVQAFLVTPSGGGQPASFQVTVLSRLESLQAADMLIADDMKDLAPVLTWTPADVPDKTYSLASSDPAKVAVQGPLLSAAGLGTADLTATSTEGKRQATFKVTVVQRKCLEWLEDREAPPSDKEHKKCCRETGMPCPEDPPPVDTLPPDTVVQGAP